MRQIDLDNKYLNLVAAILCKHLPLETKIYFFGSRVTASAKPYSDIDLLIDTGTPLSLEQLSLLITEFDESLLPYKVDIADANTISDAFRLAIYDQLVPFNFVAHGNNKL